MATLRCYYFFDETFFGRVFNIKENFVEYFIDNIKECIIPYIFDVPKDFDLILYKADNNLIECEEYVYWHYIKNSKDKRYIKEENNKVNLNNILIENNIHFTDWTRINILFYNIKNGIDIENNLLQLSEYKNVNELLKVFLGINT